MKNNNKEEIKEAVEGSWMNANINMNMKMNMNTHMNECCVSCWDASQPNRRNVWILNFLYISLLRGLLWTLRGSCYCFSCCCCCCSCCSCYCWGIVVSFSQFIQLAQQLLPDKLLLMKLTPDIMRPTRKEKGGRGEGRRRRKGTRARGGQLNEFISRVVYTVLGLLGIAL